LSQLVFSLCVLAIREFKFRRLWAIGMKSEPNSDYSGVVTLARELGRSYR